MHNVVWGYAEILLSIFLFQDFSNLVDLKISIFFRTDFYNWYHSQWNSEDKKCENLLIAC